MCGICGFHGFEDRNVLKRMIKVLFHQGLDENGLYSDENEDGTLWITYNSETYNFMDLFTFIHGKSKIYDNGGSEVWR